MTAFNLRLCTAATNTDTMNANEGGSVTYNYGGEGGIRTHGTVSRTLAFEASTFNRSVTSPRSMKVRLTDESAKRQRQHWEWLLCKTNARRVQNSTARGEKPLQERRTLLLPNS